MHRHRLEKALGIYPLPRPTPPPVTPNTFVACPLVCPAALMPWQLALYQWAFEQAQAAATPSLPERDLCGYWN